MLTSARCIARCALRRLRAKGQPRCPWFGTDPQSSKPLYMSASRAGGRQPVPFGVADGLGDPRRLRLCLGSELRTFRAAGGQYPGLEEHGGEACMAVGLAGQCSRYQVSG